MKLAVLLLLPQMKLAILLLLLMTKMALLLLLNMKTDGLLVLTAVANQNFQTYYLVFAAAVKKVHLPLRVVPIQMD